LQTKANTSCEAFSNDEHSTMEALVNFHIHHATPQSVDALSRPEIDDDQEIFDRIHQQMEPVQQPSPTMKHSRKARSQKAIPMETRITASAQS
jgi:hypothetical protein